MSAAESAFLKMENVSKTFGRAKALAGVSLDVRLGEIHALMGENGAGKSTLMKILSGAYTPDPGSAIHIDGKQVDITDPHAAQVLGISIIYQELSLAPNLTVAENIYLGREVSKGALISRSAMEAGAQAILSRLHARFGPKTKLGSLSIAERQLVEIARALHFRSQILVMDEPTTTLSERETEYLFKLMKQLRSEGLAIVYISHRMNEVYELADRVSVLRDGTYVGTLDRSEIVPETVVKMMVGRDLSSFYKKEHKPGEAPSDVVVRIADLGDNRKVRSCSFDVHRGEVLGIAGLVGAGRTELARLICGADSHATGSIELDGRQLNIRTPLDAAQAGIAYLTEDRKQLGLFLDMTVSENLNLGVIGKDSKCGLLNRAKARLRSANATKAMKIKAASSDVTVGGLSGGNQQKVLLARLLETQPRFLILDEPTRGVDIGAKSEIYRLIDEVARSGMAVAVISSELAEIVGICDRVLVMREGRIGGVLKGAEITQENIMAIATAA
jgi:ribose transport system ATP-binding protein